MKYEIYYYSYYFCQALVLKPPYPYQVQLSFKKHICPKGSIQKKKRQNE